MAPSNPAFGDTIWIRGGYNMASVSVQRIGERWRAQVKSKGRKSISKTFAAQREAKDWGAKVKAEIEGQRPALLSAALTVGKLLAEYRRMREDVGRPIDPCTNVHYMLAHLDEDLGGEVLQDLTPKRIVEWARARQAQGAGGYTVNMELSMLGTAIRHTGAYLQVTLPDVVGLARPLLHYGQLISGGGRRTRKPNDDELSSLLAWLEAERGQDVADAVRVSSIVGLRRGELVRIEWADLDELRKAVLVRQRKHPRRIMAKDEWVPLLGDAWAIVQRQPRIEGRIFPFSAERLTDSVTAGTRALGIPDLRLHDMRRQANTALRALGFDDDARRAVVGHASKEMNSRYVAIDLEELHAQYETATQGKPQHPQRRRAVPGRQT